MRLVKFSCGDQNGEGFLADDGIHVYGGLRPGPVEEAPFELSRVAPDSLPDLRSGASERIALSDVKLAAPVDLRAKVICIGLNYRDHVAEGAVLGPRDPEGHPALFTKELDAIVGPGEALVRPLASETFDYEGELAVVIGRPCRHVSPSEAGAYIGGYTCFMDGSVREYQNHSASAGKNFWRSSAMGPAVVTADEVPGIGSAELLTRVNGDARQRTTTDLMIFSVNEIIAYCSRWTWLRPGDVIATGTPSGVALFRKPPPWLKPGDQVEVEIAGVGLLRNPVIDERATDGPGRPNGQ
jgi:2-keto-4-pentenoate hydratase/2-oxohepta-3-ene-1,7-dioic acid hydratase in catechol pathway